MKLVFVNPTHPQVEHVSGMRLSFLAREMSRRGHQVILLTSTLVPSDRASVAPPELAGALARHDWSLPLNVAVPPRPMAGLEAARGGSLPAAARKAINFYHLVRHLGVFEDWVSGCAPHADAIAASWAPDLVWGTFGNTSTLKVAQRIARRCGAPWLIDFKDSWTGFVPAHLRRYLAWRFRDATAATANAEFTRATASGWFARLEISVVYSGVADAFFADGAHDAAGPANEILLIGGIYSEARLREFLAALRDWLRSRPERVRFTYLGVDRERVRRVVDEVQLPCEVELKSFVDIAEMARRCRRAVASCYIKHEDTFHHKLLELLVAGRPVVCYPGESDEARSLGRSFRTPLLSCATVDALPQALSRAWQLRGEPGPPSERSPWSWEARAAELEAIFASALARRSATG